MPLFRCFTRFIFSVGRLIRNLPTIRRLTLAIMIKWFTFAHFVVIFKRFFLLNWLFHFIQLLICGVLVRNFQRLLAELSGWCNYYGTVFRKFVNYARTLQINFPTIDQFKALTVLTFANLSTLIGVLSFLTYSPSFMVRVFSAAIHVLLIFILWHVFIIDKSFVIFHAILVLHLLITDLVSAIFRTSDCNTWV